MSIQYDVLYKYVPPHRLDMLKHGCIRFTPYSSVNDPFEFSCALQPPTREITKAYSDDYLAERYETLTFLQNNFGHSEVAMWHHDLSIGLPVESQPKASENDIFPQQR